MYTVKLQIDNGISEDTLLKENYIEVAPPIGLNENTVNKISVYPNPAGSFVVFDFADETPPDQTEIIIRDITGQLLTNTKIDRSPNRISWRTDGIDSGVYFYRVKSAGYSINGKIVIQQ